MENQNINEAVQLYKDKLFEFEQFLPSVLAFFEKHRSLNRKPFPIIHSIKSRLKEPSHLEQKLYRKLEKGKEINKSNLFDEITDFIGVRVLHLYQEQFIEINNAIQEKIQNGDWLLIENPKAMTWDPESIQFYNQLNIERYFLY
jgi:ppGpp synthetase/RelA/SpoT-type nucleotidyltranferase